MARSIPKSNVLLLLTVGLLAWLIPGAGHVIVKERKRALIIFVAILVTFGIGISVGSVAVINPVGDKPWYVAQIMNSPMVAALGYLTATRGYFVFGWPKEVGQIYTSTAGLLNLLCIVNAVYLAYLRATQTTGD
ncbi:MAG: DUF6677 family protein [Planctomycetota bacterium]|jgi:hypothetical protein